MGPLFLSVVIGGHSPILRSKMRRKSRGIGSKGRQKPLCRQKTGPGALRLRTRCVRIATRTGPPLPPISLEETSLTVKRSIPD